MRCLCVILVLCVFKFVLWELLLLKLLFRRRAKILKSIACFSRASADSLLCMLFWCNFVFYF